MNIDHVGIVTEDSTLLINMLQKYFDGQAGKRVVDEDGFTSQFISFENGSMEILEPTKKESVIGRFLEKTGGGLHHISIKVKNIENTVKRMKDDNYEFIDQIQLYQKGDKELKYIFLNPKYTNKILIELHEQMK